jgi:hypothetical protein
MAILWRKSRDRASPAPARRRPRFAFNNTLILMKEFGPVSAL